MRVLLTDPHMKGGGQVRYVANLARELVRRGHEVTIGCKPGSVLVDRAAEAGCKACARFVFRGGLRPLSWTRDLRLARAWIRENKPDIVHVSGSQDHWIFAITNSLMGRPTCVVRTRHNTYPVSANSANRLLNRTLTDYTIAVCEVVARDLAAHAAFDSARICAIQNGVYPDAFAPNDSARAGTRLEFGFDDGHIVVGIVARLVPAKGHRFLFEAAARLKPAHPELRLLILGQGDLEAELRELARHLQIDSIVRFAGFREDMARCVQAIDIGVQPSIDCDTASFSLKELMSAEKPVIASDYGGLVEIVNDGAEGFVVASGQTESLQQALERLLRDPVLRRDMGVAGRRRVIAEFSAKVFADRTIDAYQRALNR